MTFLKKQILYFIYFQITCLVGLGIHLATNVFLLIASPTTTRLVIIAIDLIAEAGMAWNLRNLNTNVNRFINWTITLLNFMAVGFFVFYGAGLLTLMTAIFVVVMGLLFLKIKTAIFIILGNIAVFLGGYFANSVWGVNALVGETTLKAPLAFIYYSIDGLGLILLVTLILRARVVVLEKWNEEFIDMNQKIKMQEEALKALLDICTRNLKTYYILLNFEQNIVWCSPQFLAKFEITPVDGEYPEFSSIVEILTEMDTLQETIGDEFTLITIHPNQIVNGAKSH